MTRTEIFEELKEIMQQNYEINPDKIAEKATIIEDIGVVSLEFMNFILDVEKKFDIIYNFEVNIDTMEDLIEFILSKNN